MPDSTASKEISRLYQHTLLRDPDAAGAAYWEAESEKRGLGEITWDFIESEEAQDAGYSVIASYQIIFGRVPDKGGLAYWQQLVDERNDVDFMLEHHIASEEFQSRFNPDDREGFIKSLYINTFGREPEPEGLQYWMDTEYTFPQLVRAFMSSTEWQERAHTKIAEFHHAVKNGEESYVGSLFDVEPPVITRIGNAPLRGPVSSIPFWKWPALRARTIPLSCFSTAWKPLTLSRMQKGIGQS